MERNEIGKIPQPLYMMTADDLAEHTRKVVRETVEILMADKSSDAERHDDKLLTAKEAMSHLRICHSTLWKLEKKGRLIPVRIGRRTFYRLDDIERITQTVK